MKRLIISSFLLAFAFQGALSQDLKMAEEGTPYYLPRTKMCFSVKVEKTVYTPGEYAVYAEKYLKLADVKTEPQTSWRVLSIRMHTEGDRDTSKLYVAPTDFKNNIKELALDENGCLAAINAKAKVAERPVPFTPVPKPKALNPRDYMNEDILSAGSSAKMAELSALEIYDIRESRSALSKGQADFMPKDGEQLRIMLNSLDTQERALMQLFNGVTVRDTVEIPVEYIPEKAVDKLLLFRFSKWAGIVDNDDLSGTPYYITVEDLKMQPSLQEHFLNNKGVKDNGGIYVNLPGKLKATLFNGQNIVAAYEFYAGQFGEAVRLNDAMFNKKFETSIVLNPVTGSAERLESEPLKK